MTAFDDLMDGMMDLVTDTLGRSVKLFKPGTMATADFATGTRSYGSPTEYTINANEGPRRQVAVQQEAGGEIAVWVKTFEIRLADLSGQLPTRKWRMDASDGTWATACEIVNVELDANGKGAVLLVRDNI